MQKTQKNSSKYIIWLSFRPWNFLEDSKVLKRSHIPTIFKTDFQVRKFWNYFSWEKIIDRWGFRRSLWTAIKNILYWKLYQNTIFKIFYLHFKYIIITDFNLSILRSNKGFCLSVCLWLYNSKTAEPIWLNFFLLAPSWSHGGYRPKNSGSGIRFLRKFRKIDIEPKII